jgi:general secretion pathway protein E
MTTQTPETPPSEQPAPQRQLLGQYCLAQGWVTPAVLDAALDEHRVTSERLGQVLVRNGFISRSRLLQAILATNPDMVHDEKFFSARIPSEILLEHEVMLVAETSTTLYAATLGSEAEAELALAPHLGGRQLEFVAAGHEDLDDYLAEVEAVLGRKDSMVTRYVRLAVESDASDIHILPRRNTYTLMFRVDGVRKAVHEGSLDEYTSLAARIKDLSKMDIAERRVPQDGGFSIEFRGRSIDVRVATVPTPNGETLVLRMLDPDKVNPSLFGLGITRLAEWRKGMSWPDGLCLICGPTGSGKTTTLAASLKEMDRFGRAIYTAEDPIEYQLPFVSQVNINPLVGLDFSRAVKAFMRADPDIIITGEVRDPDTARNCIKGAETGHLMLATLHTGSIFGAKSRLRDLGVDRNELVHILRAVMVQRLIRKLCLDCGGQGCDTCGGTGYKGRTLVTECAHFSTPDEVSRMLDDESWWPSMIDDMVVKLREGISDVKEAVRVFGEAVVPALLAAGFEVPATVFSTDGGASADPSPAPSAGSTDLSDTTAASFRTTPE